jgi:hypothetical protein
MPERRGKQRACRKQKPPSCLAHCSPRDEPSGVYDYSSGWGTIPSF